MALLHRGFILPAGQYYSIHDLVLSETIHVSPLQQPAMAPFGTVEASLQGETFMVSLSLVSLCPSSKVNPVFRHRVLPSSYQSRTTKRNGNSLGPPWIAICKVYLMSGTKILI